MAQQIQVHDNSKLLGFSAHRLRPSPDGSASPKLAVVDFDPRRCTCSRNKPLCHHNEGRDSGARRRGRVPRQGVQDAGSESHRLAFHELCRLPPRYPQLDQPRTGRARTRQGDPARVCPSVPRRVRPRRADVPRLPPVDEGLPRSRFRGLAGVPLPFLDGKYPHFALNYWLRQQCRLRRQTPATFWGLLIPLEEGGPLDNLASLASPSPQTLDPVREQAFATGDIEYVGAMYTILKYLLRDEYGKGALQWTTEDDFNEQFCRAWDTTVEAIEEWGR